MEEEKISIVVTESDSDTLEKNGEKKDGENCEVKWTQEEVCKYSLQHSCHEETGCTLIPYTSTQRAF